MFNDTFTLEEVQEWVLDLLRDNLAQDVEEVSIPDDKTLLKDPKTGKTKPYYAIQFGDIFKVEGSSSGFVGPRYDDHTLPLYIQAVAPDASIARRLYNRLQDLMLGQARENSAGIYKRFSGGSWPIVGTNFATEAYIFPSGFGVNFQLAIANQ